MKNVHQKNQKRLLALVLALCLLGAFIPEAVYAADTLTVEDVTAEDYVPQAAEMEDAAEEYTPLEEEMELTEDEYAPLEEEAEEDEETEAAEAAAGDYLTPEDETEDTEAEEYVPRAEEELVPLLTPPPSWNVNVLGSAPWWFDPGMFWSDPFDASEMTTLALNMQLPQGITLNMNPSNSRGWRWTGGSNPNRGIDPNGQGRSITFSHDFVAGADEIIFYTGGVHGTNMVTIEGLADIWGMSGIMPWQIAINNAWGGGWFEPGTTARNEIRIDVSHLTRSLTLEWPWGASSGWEPPGRLDIRSIDVVSGWRTSPEPSPGPFGAAFVDFTGIAPNTMSRPFAEILAEPGVVHVGNWTARGNFRSSFDTRGIDPNGTGRVISSPVVTGPILVELTANAWSHELSPAEFIVSFAGQTQVLRFTTHRTGPVETHFIQFPTGTGPVEISLPWGFPGDSGPPGRGVVRRIAVYELFGPSPSPSPSPMPSPSPTPFPTDTTVTVRPAFANPGGRVTVDVDIQNNPGFAGMSLRIDYDDTMFSLVTAEPGQGFGSGFTSPPVDTASPIHLIWGYTANLTGDGTLVRLTFDVAGGISGGGNSQRFDINASFMTVLGNPYPPSDADGITVPMNTENGYVLVYRYRLGDVNGDGRLSMVDVTRLSRFLSGHNVILSSDAAADVDGNGVIGPGDIVRLGRYIMRHSGVYLGHAG